MQVQVRNNMKFSCTSLTLSAQAEVEIDNRDGKLVDALAHSHFALHNYMMHLWTHLHICTLADTLALSSTHTFSFHLHLHIYITHSKLLTFLVHHFCTISNSHVKCSLQSCLTNIHCTPTHTDAQKLLTFMCDLIIFMT